MEWPFSKSQGCGAAGPRSGPHRGACGPDPKRRAADHPFRHFLATAVAARRSDTRSNRRSPEHLWQGLEASTFTFIVAVTRASPVRKTMASAGWEPRTLLLPGGLQEENAPNSTATAAANGRLACQKDGRLSACHLNRAAQRKGRTGTRYGETRHGCSAHGILAPITFLTTMAISLV